MRCVHEFHILIERKSWYQATIAMQTKGFDPLLLARRDPTSLTDETAFKASSRVLPTG